MRALLLVPYALPSVLKSCIVEMCLRAPRYHRGLTLKWNKQSQAQTQLMAVSVHIIVSTPEGAVQAVDQQEAATH